MLKDLLYKVSILSVSGDTSLEVKDLHSDSREVQKGSCFIALRGSVSDGHDHIVDAVNNGAVAVICEKMPVVMAEGVTYVAVESTAAAAGYMSHNFFGEPTKKFQLVGVTGTNGKTTIATLLYQLFTGLGYTCGLVSTVQNEIAGVVRESTHTTPEAIKLNKLLGEMAEAGCTHVFMECSSHAIEQQRIAGLQFAGGIFSNITHEHLDYHKSFNEYIRVKKLFFDSLPKTAFAISNLDDKRGLIMLQNTKAKKYAYSLKSIADFKGKILENSLSGLHLLVNDVEVHFKMIGGFNAYNLLAVYGAAICLGENKLNVLQVCSNLSGAEGRFDYSISAVDNIIGIVDYAHTPDALLNVLVTIKNLRKGFEKVITVVGCGGNRDKAKRPLMAEVACEYSDKVIFTSDNPREEEPGQILQDMVAGVNAAAKRKYITIADRYEAIKAAVSLSAQEDIVLIAGKGHEKYQEIKGVKYDFDDKKVLREMFALMQK